MAARSAERGNPPCPTSLTSLSALCLRVVPLVAEEVPVLPVLILVLVALSSAVFPIAEAVFGSIVLLPTCSVRVSSIHTPSQGSSSIENVGSFLLIRWY